MVYMPPHEVVEAHHIVMKVKSADAAIVVATINVELHEVPRPTGLLPGEGRQVPVVVPMHKVVFPAVGRYDLQVDLDHELAGDLIVHRRRTLTRSEHQLHRGDVQPPTELSTDFLLDRRPVRSRRHDAGRRDASPLVSMRAMIEWKPLSRASAIRCSISLRPMPCPAWDRDT